MILEQIEEDDIPKQKQIKKLCLRKIKEFSSILTVLNEHENIFTIATGEWGGDSGDRGL